MKCKHCKITMEKGTCLRERYQAGIPDFIDQKDNQGQTHFPSGESDLITVWKCPQCGYSHT